MSNENPQMLSLQASNIGIGSYVVNDYLLTVEISQDGNGYLFTIKKGTQEQTIHLTELTEESAYEVISQALAEAKASGEFDGTSPSASVSKVNNKATITITDINGTTTVDVYDGVKGDKGDPGIDVTVTDTTLNIV